MKGVVYFATFQANGYELNQIPTLPSQCEEEKWLPFV